MQVGKRYQITQKGIAGRKGKSGSTQVGEVVDEFEKFYLVKTENYKITVMKSAIKSGECKFKEIKQAVS